MKEPIDNVSGFPSKVWVDEMAEESSSPEQTEKDAKKVYDKATENVPALYKDVTLEEMDQLAVLMRQPMKALDRCISKDQMRTLCKQLLLQNLRLQQKLAVVSN